MIRSSTSSTKPDGAVRGHHRRNTRLKGYDYSKAGAYFVTVCTQGRLCLFGEVVGAEMRLNAAGRAMVTKWTELPYRYLTTELDVFVVMPNHIHGILVIRHQPVGASLVPAPTIGDVIGAFKSATTVVYVRGVKHSGWTPFRGRLWQRNYFDHVIRNEESLNRIRQYVLENPSRWPDDYENPTAFAPGTEQRIATRLASNRG